jgi:hypothetical protein
MLASSSEDRINSPVALSPRRSWTALRMMDFPAPVSPERILRPFEKVKFSSSIMAKFLIRSSCSITFSDEFGVLSSETKELNV